VAEMNEPENKAQDTALILPFGKHKGERIDEVMRVDPGWVEWVMAQPWFRDRHPTLVQVVVNGGALADADTPEHNRLQALFLDPGMCAAAYRLIVGDARITDGLRDWLRERSHRACCKLFRAYGCDRCPYAPFAYAGVEAARLASVALYEAQIAKASEVRKAADQAASEADSAYWDLLDKEGRAGQPSRADWPGLREAEAAKEQAHASEKAVVEAALAKGEEAARAEIELLAAGAERAALFAEIAKKVEFEVGGWDVVLPEAGSKHLPAVAIELKPSLGDDYPAVLRKLKTRRRSGQAALIVDRFAADGATWDQVVRMFEASGFAVKTLAELRG
jgi:hypothetical protein